MLALVVQVDPADAELVADALWSLGVVAIEERVADDGRVELWTSLGDDRQSIERALGERISGDAIDVGLRCSWRLVEIDESVADSWRDHARPTWIEPDLVIVPAWLPAEAELPDQPGEPITVVSIDPGATFGAGDHPTTVLSLRALRRLLRSRQLRSMPATASVTVLDVGCGSGVLAVSAVRLGAPSAVGIDISPAAVPVTTANARRNGVASAVSVSVTPLRDVAGTYDIVVANILAPALVELAVDLVRLLADGGALVISGVLVDRFEHVLAALAPLRVDRVDQLDGWAAVTLVR